MNWQRFFSLLQSFLYEKAKNDIDNYKSLVINENAIFVNTLYHKNKKRYCNNKFFA